MSSSARRILLASGIVVVAAGLVRAGYWWGSMAREPAGSPARTTATLPPQAPSATPVSNGASGPWGRLKTLPLWLAPHPDLLDPDLCPLESPPWTFPGFSRNRLESFLDSLELPAGSRALLRTTSRCNARGCTVRPPPSLQEALSPAARSRLFEEVLRDPDSPFLPFLLVFDEEDLRSWMRLSRMPPEWQRWIQGLVFAFRGSQALADLPLACLRAPSARDRSQVLRAWATTPTRMAWLEVGPEDDAASLATWWSRFGNRRKDLLPLLESAREIPGGVDLDLVHLLPRGSRTRLYSYPSPGDPPRDCLWTVLNFGVEQPDDSVLDSRVAMERLAKQYRAIEEDERRMGDAMLIWTPEGRLVHAALWLADDLFLSKNGRHALNPWILTNGKSLRDLYNPEGRMLVRWMRRIDGE
ncbi:hypothetical protein KBD49_08080 [Myxococcota bacterium]|nr:hypothetical protein [Myxococcota bacterium]